MAGRIGAARGADELWLSYQKVRDNGDLRIFVCLALDDHPEDAEQIEARIVAAARELLDRPGTPTRDQADGRSGTIADHADGGARRHRA